jgi:YebC/PmpR family DNA-binding regulatory protein
VFTFVGSVVEVRCRFDRKDICFCFDDFIVVSLCFLENSGRTRRSSTKPSKYLLIFCASLFSSQQNINRAIKRASEANAGDFSESTFEAYGFGGASFVINVLSDNANRATSDVKSTVNKRNGKIAEQGSVLFMYDRKGKIEVKGDSVLDEERLLDVAIEAGVDDFSVEANSEEGSTIVLVEPSDCATMFDAIKEAGLCSEGGSKMSLAWISKAPVECADEDFEKNMDIIEALEELDDVDSVEHNMSN